MNLKTTLFLVILVGGGAAAGWYLHFQRPAAPTTASKTIDFLEKELKPEALVRIELTRGKDSRFILQRADADWALPGRWPVRAQETQELLQTLAGMRSRFTPIAIAADTDLKKYGFSDAALVFKLKIGDKDRTLTIAEEPGEQNRFTRAVYLRLDNEPEIIRLGPGLIAALDRAQDYFQQRRLFLPERVAKDDEGKEKIEQVQAQEIRVQGPDGKFTAVKEGAEWLLTEPIKDHADPEKLKNLLVGLPDFWAEKFIDKKDKKWEEFGLEKPEYSLRVTRSGGAAVKLLIGKVSRTDTKITLKPPPPNQFGMPQKPIPFPVTEEYRFAKLENNDQVFEIKAEKLKDVAQKFGDLRDAHVARFKSDDVKRVEIQQPKETLVLVKDKEKWKFEKPVTLDAESQPITELLDKLSGLRADEKDIRDGADPKALGLEKPHAVIKIALEEGKDKKQRDVTFQFGQTDKEKGKLFVRVAGWPRVNALADDLLKLVDRPVLAYRQRKVLDLAGADLTKIEIARGGEDYTLDKKDGVWNLTKPANTRADAAKAEQLAGDLARLESVEFVADAPKEEDLDKVYGLAKAPLRATLYFSDAKKPPQTLLVGQQRAGKDEWYARLDKGSVFVIKKDVRELLDRDSLTYRPLDLWQVAPADLQEIRVQQDAGAYVLTRKDKDWRIAGPFEATATASAVEAITDEIARIKGEKFVAHAAKELAKFGLDKPYLSIEIAAKSAKETAKHKLLVGKPVEKDEKNRYAQIDGDAAVFVVSDKLVSALAKSALDLLDRELVSVSTKSIQRVQTKGSTPFTLEQKKDDWHVTGSPAPEFKAEDEAVQSFLRPWSRLRAERIAAYGPKIDWKEFGLDKPAVHVTVTISSEADKEKKSAEYALALGKETGKGERFARLDQQPAVVVLDAATTADLARSHLDFVNHRVLKYDLDTVTGIVRQMKDGDLELVKRDDQWRFAKPDKQADDITVGDVLEKTFRLRAQRIAAYPAKDLKAFGLEQPTATVTLKLADPTGAPVQHVIKIGDLAKESGKTNHGERYALIDKGDAVVVLAPELSKHLAAPALHFADRNVASFGTADTVAVERGPRKAVFVKADATWKMTAPVKADAEDAALDDFLKDLRRLRVDEVVAEKGDLKQFGLDRPHAQWTCSAGGKDVLTLLVGNPEAGKEKEPGARRYAKLAKSDAIFLLSAKQSAKALDEYRSRKPWPTLDAVQVEQVSFGGAAPFTLTKNEKLWTVAGKPELKVNAKAVSDTLDALAGLKAERWLADEKGDLQLHGLQPPQVTIDLQTSTGKRSLLIGRPEGSSQRVYAAVAGETAIFVLSEDDARRIVRPLAGYLEK